MNGWVGGLMGGVIDRWMEWMDRLEECTNELMDGRVAAILGKEGDASPFTDVSVDKVSKVLHGLGYQMRGFEVMYNGHTGRRLR
eukprot:scaffold296510_cov20-Prasinocladus_malaysianus.AAC.1